ncbi:MAG: Spo0E family sporulation regulatory protein-aspartic acid phosphatase [Clostridiaceae bacterium]|nr:Spo0E family sporulation regulatory protein-aspartic acid phosphatase [Clostridiaceae bacterium]
MKDLYEQLKEKLSLLEGNYDIIRIVDPTNKKSIIIKDKEIKNIEGRCYAHWKRDRVCNNCISMKSYIEKDTFIKIEHVHNKVILVTSTPVLIEGEVYVIEMLKDISKNGMIFDINSNANIGVIINELNEKAISDGLISVNNRTLINDDYINMDSNRLSILNSKIEELRDILNEMCLSSDETVEDKEKLIISQYLDELIVEYMKNNIQLKSL